MTINADSTVQILAEEAVPLERLDPQVQIVAFSHKWTSFKVAQCNIHYEQGSPSSLLAEALITIKLLPSLLRCPFSYLVYMFITVETLP